MTATDIPQEEIECEFRVYEIGKSKKFGLLLVKYQGEHFEVAQFRQDGSYGDGRRPETVEIIGSFEDDASRRDFTINAMGINYKGEIFDYFDGQRDVKNRVLRTVGDPIKRFKEDRIRIMRAARFASQFDIKIDPKIRIAARRLASTLRDEPGERIRDEIVKAAEMGGEKFARYIEILDELRILQIVLPEVAALKYKPHSKKGHPESDNVLGHVIAALRSQPEIRDPLTNLAILLHDIGKLVTQDVKDMPWGRAYTYPKHAEEGVEIVNKIAKRMRLKNNDKDRLVFAALNHMRVHELLEMRPAKVAKLVNDDNWNVLLAVARADRSCRPRGVETEREMEKILQLAGEIKRRAGTEVMNRITKMVSGSRVMKLTGIKPGPEVGRIKNTVLQLIIDNEVEDQEEIDRYIQAVGDGKSVY